MWVTPRTVPWHMEAVQLLPDIPLDARCMYTSASLSVNVVCDGLG